MNILGMISGYDGCGYYRLQLPCKYIIKNHIPYKIGTFFNTEDIKNCNVLVLQKQFKDNIFHYFEYAKSLKIPIISEIDDDYFSIVPNNSAYKYYAPIKPLIKKIIQESDAITVTTEYLKNTILPLNKNVYVLPNSLDFTELDRIKASPDIYKHTRYLDKDKNPITLEEAKNRMKDRVIIGWGGSATHLDDLNIVTPVLLELCKKYPEILLVMMGCTTQDILDKTPSENLILVHPIMIHKYHQVLCTMEWDIGICPIVNNEFNKSKSNLKFLEYAQKGFACVCSDVENYTKTVTHMKTGLLSKPNDWYSNLEYLIKNPEVRKELGKNAEEFVRSKYDIKNNVFYWIDCYQKEIERGKLNGG